MGELTQDAVKNMCYDIARKVCLESQKDIESSCQYKRENIASKTDIKIGEISAGEAMICARFDEHLKLHERSEAFWKWFALFIVVLTGASNFIQKLFLG